MATLAERILLPRRAISMVCALLAIFGGFMTYPPLLTASAANPFKVQTISTKEYLTGSLVHLRVSSPESDYPMREIFTWTPPLTGQNPDSLPVVYFLHGWPGSPSSMIKGVTASLLKSFQKGAKPFIAAFPDGNARTHVDSEWADSSDGKARIETWLTSNAIAAVEGSRLRSRNERAIVGFSMGGYGAAIIGLHHPELFGQVATLAGYFLVDDLTGAFNGKAKISYQSPDNFMSAAKQLRWYLAEASDDYTIPIHGEMSRWSKKLIALKIPVATHAATGGHSFIFVANEAALISRWFSWPQVTSLPVATPAPTLSPPPTPIGAVATSPSATPSLATTPTSP